MVSKFIRRGNRLRSHRGERYGKQDSDESGVISGVTKFRTGRNSRCQLAAVDGASFWIEHGVTISTVDVKNYVQRQSVEKLVNKASSYQSIC